MVAHKVLGDALPVLAHELVLRVAGAVGVHCKRREIKRANWGRTTARLVFLRDFLKCDSSDSLQPALTLSSAPSGQSLSPSHFQRCGTHMYEPGHWKASGLQVFDSGQRHRKVAIKGSRTKRTKNGWSRSSLTALLVLVRAVAAVVGAVAHPVGGDAVVVGALKLAGRAEFVCRGQHRGTIQLFIELLKEILGCREFGGGASVGREEG